MRTLLRGTAQIGQVIAIAAVLAACSGAGAGDSSKPVPAWSPPNWMHGTWKATGDAGTATMKASRHNVEIDVSVSGISYSVDMAQLAEDGFVEIDYEVGADSDSGLRFYFVLIVAADGAATGYTFYRLSDTQIEAYQFTKPAGGVRTDSPATILTKQT